uniref:WGS project CAEQ00000000 data, annotated contig 2079 n=1 Tax=Trypanosoma congolense (strain IL3000) TaxID=1068625 RepID=F9WB99_TRYCI|nr:unnamed protein product [Trypanosoma congolense IL3000]
MFRQSLGVYVSKLRAAKDGLGKSQLSGAEMQQPTVDPGAIEKAHEMIIEYSASRLLGNYRKGMTSGASRNSSVKNRNSNPAAQRSDDVAFSIDYQRFLPDNLGNNANFARLIVNTRMYHNWEYAVLSLETAGLIRSLNGEFVRKHCGSRPQQGRANETSKCCTDSVPVSYYLSHPRMVGLLSDFYIRCARRFTDLFPDLPAAETSRISAALAAKVGGSDTSSSSSSRRSSKGLMRSLFSKATRAVKSTLTSSRQRVTVRVFVQARSSLFNDEKHNDPDRIVKTNKTAQVISSNSPISPQEQALELNCRGIAVPISPGDVEDDPCKASSNAGGSAELDNLSMFESGTKADGVGISVSCRLLPLDVIHNFGLYHDLLNPTKENAYTTGCQQTTTQCLSVEEAQIFVELARLFVCYNNVWKLIEARRQLLPTGCVEPSQPAVQTLESLPDLWSRGDAGGCSQVVFEAQPLPFPKDLIAGSLELPPLP